jgi:predicted RNA-binding Zn-ribbon protein involved in translation (DUF1610 family)
VNIGNTIIKKTVTAPGTDIGVFSANYGEAKMFCPNCGDIRGNVERLNDDSKKQNKFRCPICGHVFIYISCPHLEKKYGDGTHIYDMDDDGIIMGRRR